MGSKTGGQNRRFEGQMDIQLGRQKNGKICPILKYPFSYNKASKLEDVLNTNCHLFQYRSWIGMEI